MYRRILVPIDGSPTAERGFEEGLALARALGSTLVLLHVVEYMPSVPEMAPTLTWEQVWKDLREAGQGLLERAHARARDAGVDAEARLEDVAATRAAVVIAEQAAALHCDLVVMGTHGRRALARALLGSDAEFLVRHSPVPVLLVRHAE